MEYHFNLVFIKNFRLPGDESTPICRLRDIRKCDDIELVFTIQFKVKQCNCLPDCTSIGYAATTSQVQFYHPESEEERRDDYVHTG